MYEPIAIIGLGCLYPNASNVELFWEALQRGIIADRSDHDGQKALTLIPHFDCNPQKYKFPPSHLRHLPRLHLMIQEVIWQALQDAGYGSRTFPRSSTDVVCGFYLGFDRTGANTLRIATNQIFDLVQQHILPHLPLDRHTIFCQELAKQYHTLCPALPNDKVYELASTVAAKTSILHQLQNRCLAIEASDMTAFISLDVAVSGLRQQCCDMAIVACGQLLENPLLYNGLEQKHLLSPTPMIPFSAQQNGYTLGEGIGAVILKRLSDAIEQNDRIYAIIRGIGMAREPKPGGFRYTIAPQTLTTAIDSAYADPDFKPNTWQFMECAALCLPNLLHTEIAAIQHVLARYGEASPSVALGSTKELLGHTFANSGLASLSKVALSLYHKILIPQHYGHDKFIQSPASLPIATSLVPWPPNRDGLPRRSGINGYGLGGGCGHIALEEYEPSYHKNLLPHHYHFTADLSLNQPQPGLPLPVGNDWGTEPDKIALVAMGCHFAQSADMDIFWNNILRNRDLFTPVPESICHRKIYYDPVYFNLYKTYCDLAASIPELPEISHFKILPKQAEYMDRAQRLGLLISQQLVEDYARHQTKPIPKTTGLILATDLCLQSQKKALLRFEYPALIHILERLPDFRLLAVEKQHEMKLFLNAWLEHETPPISSFSLDGFMSSGIALHIANHYQWEGQIMAIEAACASSLAALDIGIHWLREHKYDMLVVGGIDMPVTTRELVLASNARFLSHDKMRPFDVQADGFLIGEGGGIFALKRLADAIHDHDHIYAVILGIGSSSDAHSLFAPSPEGQSLAIKRAFHAAGITPDTVDLLETHGTGTKIGDQVEIQSLQATYGQYPRASPLVLGSVKSLIGHTWTAAGAASIIKVAMALHQKILPPSCNLRRINPALELEKVPAYVNTEPKAWEKHGKIPRRAGVSSFGTGGLNYHVILEEYRYGNI